MEIIGDVQITWGLEEVKMPSTWEKALRLYRWSVTFTDFKDAHQFPGWFSFDLAVGDRSKTIEFESRFRKHAQKDREAWLEVVFWKVYGIPLVRNGLTHAVNTNFQVRGISAESLWQACKNYISKPSKANFESFRQLFGFTAPVIAVAATFPAFIDPVSYPMVDTRIAKWVGKCMATHNEADRAGPQLIRPRFLDYSRPGVLAMTDYDFMRHWTLWCVHTAHKLTNHTSLKGGWRARDVEMAVFRAWGGRGKQHPELLLNPLSGD
jgi:hypothetical protein